VDEYALYRDVWLQRRNYQIHQAGRRRATQPEADLPPYLLEDGQDMPTDSAPTAPAGS
jgi:phospholipid-binding lipoprotein MlaA